MKNLIVAASLFLAHSVITTSASTQQPLHDLDTSFTSSLISLHKSLVEIPSISGAERNVSSFLIEYMKSKNFTVKSQAVSETRENVLAYSGRSLKTRTLVTSHIDTVPPFWPYERHGDEIWGRGTVDAKGSVASQIIAVESLLQSSEISEGDVGLLFVVGEERGGEGMRVVNDLGLSWDTVIFGEPTELKLASGHKGGMGFTLKAKGKAGHSGYPELGKSATHMLIQALAALDGLTLPSSERFGNTTINIGKLEGGVAANVIAEDASAVVSIRVAAGNAKEISELVEKTIHDAVPDIQIDFTLGIGPVAIDHDVDGFETAVMNYGTDIPALKGDHKRYLYGPGTILVASIDFTLGIGPVAIDHDVDGE
ncbi:related to diaminopropionate ammonia-lyase [Phialocephala subalpina]|uniref:Related to diaminopropionate ammonia-lyase n=1 Tax=Phialocephala subalpina TaxID=576137 RepID=A0A1L7WLR2_9HELO|nr:related to diaminopropionate ammonia-lyase [Phialocephala subalpina]